RRRQPALPAKSRRRGPEYDPVRAEEGALRRALQASLQSRRRPALEGQYADSEFSGSLSQPGWIANQRGWPDNWRHCSQRRRVGGRLSHRPGRDRRSVEALNLATETPAPRVSDPEYQTSG